jgi:hypothetical protein
MDAENRYHEPDHDADDLHDNRRQKLHQKTREKIPQTKDRDRNDDEDTDLLPETE